ncbi:MAG: rhomboid family intramembrane serine protease, partial [Anaerolineae bacterium]|nr:rhomboid family intramembrane serine protease [Anaerolineae bacterium]
APASPDEQPIIPQPPRIEPRRIAIQLPPRLPQVTFAIIGLTSLIFLLQLASPNLIAQGFASRCPYFYTRDLPACFGMKVNELIIQGQWWRLLTPMLLHANLIHIAFNMYALYIFGPELERFYGHKKFLALYIVSGFSGIVASFALSPEASLGASSAIFGLLGAQGVFAYQNQSVFGARARQALRSIINIAAINLLIGLSPGIDNWGHLGGLIGGGLIAWFGSPIFQLQEAGDHFTLIDQRPAYAVNLASLLVFSTFAVIALGVFFARV